MYQDKLDAKIDVLNVLLELDILYGKASDLKLGDYLCM